MQNAFEWVREGESYAPVRVEFPSHSFLLVFSKNAQFLQKSLQNRCLKHCAVTSERYLQLIESVRLQ
jgi:hypothetical protein